MVTQSWLRSFWTPSKKPDAHVQPQKSRISVLAFESASLMTKLLHLWQSLNDKQVARLREEISSSAGIRILVSDNEDYISKLICLEMTENLSHVAWAVARLSKKCSDPLLKSFEQAFNDLIMIGADPYSWQFSWRKMDRKIKKMGRFILANTSLLQEIEALADFEHTSKRLKANDNFADSITLVEYENKVEWKKREVNRLKENSLWCRTYDYTVLLLARSVFTVYGRIGYVFGINQVSDVVRVKDYSKLTDIFNSRRGHPTVFMQQSSVYPSENYVPRFSTGPPGKSSSRSGPLLRTNHNSTGSFSSGPLWNSASTCIPISEKNHIPGFYSGTLNRSATRSGPMSRTGISGLRLWQFRGRKPDSATVLGPFTGCVAGGNSPPTTSNINYSISNNKNQGNSSPENILAPDFNNKSKQLSPPPDSLGAAALALHYANVIIFIEKLAAGPHLIGSDARNDLYSMLPAGIRASLRAKLKPYAKILSSSVYDTALAGEWSEAIMKTLEWFAPMAHNMIRWQSERSFEHQNLVSRTNVLLVQTLYFANQEKTEAAITELLVGLNYIWRFGRDVNAKSLVEESTSGRTID